MKRFGVGVPEVFGVHDFRCVHSGEKDILALESGVQIGAANHAGVEYANASLVIDLAGVVPEKPRPVFSLHGQVENPALQELVARWQQPYAVLRVLWQDGAMPPPALCLPSDWRSLLVALESERRVVVCCHGGHGRTGTFLAAALLVTRQARSAEEAIATVRQRHCKRAVETDEQIQYLASLAKHV